MLLSGEAVGVEQKSGGLLLEVLALGLAGHVGCLR
jgi:hypothetical protein